MAKVNICNVMVLDNPSLFKNPFQFEITFECLEDLKEGIDLRLAINLLVTSSFGRHVS